MYNALVQVSAFSTIRTLGSPPQPPKNRTIFWSPNVKNVHSNMKGIGCTIAFYFFVKLAVKMTSKCEKCAKAYGAPLLFPFLQNFFRNVKNVHFFDFSAFLG